MRRFPSAVEHGKLAPKLLEDAYQAQDGDNLESALTVGSTFGFAKLWTRLSQHRGRSVAAAITEVPSSD